MTKRLRFEPARCVCGMVLFDGIWRGLIRIRCRGRDCGRRAWLVSSGKRARIIMVDKPRRSVRK